MRTPSVVLGLIGMLAGSLPVAAQDSIDEAEVESAGSGVPVLEVLLRVERTSDIPGRLDALERFRSRVRAGYRYFGDGGTEWGVVVEGTLGSDDNRSNIENNDNEKSDGAALDEAYVRHRFSEGVALQLGKAPLPLELTPLTWDRDLRPLGASVEFSGDVRDYDQWLLRAGAFRTDHLYDERSRLVALQAGYAWMAGAPTNVRVLVSWMGFDELVELSRSGLGRTNRRTPAGYVSDYRLLDLQLIAETPLAGRPLVARIDGVRNLGAEDLDRGARGSLVWGNAGQGGLELGWSTQRIQRDAVLAAVNEDDWWFHSFANGWMPWVAYGFEGPAWIGGRWRVQAAAFIERRDGAPRDTRRFLFDVAAEW
jgi:hypothetical protein